MQTSQQNKIVEIRSANGHAYICKSNVKGRDVYNVVLDNEVLATCMSFNAARSIWELLCVN